MAERNSSHATRQMGKWQRKMGHSAPCLPRGHTQTAKGRKLVKTLTGTNKFSNLPEPEPEPGSIELAEEKG